MDRRMDGRGRGQRLPIDRRERHHQLARDLRVLREDFDREKRRLRRRVICAGVLGALALTVAAVDLKHRFLHDCDEDH